MKILYSEDFERGIMRVAFEDHENRTFYNFVTGMAIQKNYGEPITEECMLKIPVDLFNDVVKAFAEIAGKKGLKLDADLKREGQLEATRYHLEDMRKLLKLKSLK